MTSDHFGQGANTFTIDFVEVGHPGNPPDPYFRLWPAGAVSYVYRMGKYEISEDMVEKVNRMSYLGLTTTTWGPNYPAGKMGFLEIALFVNWLNITSGYPSAYNFDEGGNWRLWPSEDAWQLGGENRYRHKGAFYFLPSVDEWHKAAFYDGSRYYRYPTGSDQPPTPVTGGTDQGTAVYLQPLEQGPAEVYNAGGLSPYGTMAQGGNIHDLLESAVDGINDSTTTDYMCLRGGWWIRGYTNLRADGADTGLLLRLSEVPGAPAGAGGSQEAGFRVASRPVVVDDQDGDGVPDSQEAIAGTDPTDPVDVLRIASRVQDGGIELSLTTRSASRSGYLDVQRLYAIDVSTDLEGRNWAPVPGYARVPGKDQVLSLNLRGEESAASFFRVRVWLEAILGPQPPRGELTLDWFGEGREMFGIEFVTVRDEGNPHDAGAGPYPMGGVSYPYRMGKYEIPEDAVNKANALGDLGITTSFAGQTRPATMMDFHERARFVNWLNTSKGYPPAYSIDSSGTWRLWSPEEAWKEGGVNLYRHAGAMYFLPSADEWYKAAYFDGEVYTLYPTGGDQYPLPVSNGVLGGTVVYQQPVEYGAADVYDAGGLSHYGTMAQGGNVTEWLETAADGLNDWTGKELQVRGGRWSASRRIIQGSASSSGWPSGGSSSSSGFRIAARAVD